jgi:hypothetical protein
MCDLLVAIQVTQHTVSKSTRRVESANWTGLLLVTRDRREVAGLIADASLGKRWRPTQRSSDL